MQRWVLSHYQTGNRCDSRGIVKASGSCTRQDSSSEQEVTRGERKKHAKLLEVGLREVETRSSTHAIDPFEPHLRHFPNLTIGAQRRQTHAKIYTIKSCQNCTHATGSSKAEHRANEGRALVRYRFSRRKLVLIHIPPIEV
jgi:hypothetical protein